MRKAFVLVFLAFMAFSLHAKTATKANKPETSISAMDASPASAGIHVVDGTKRAGISMRQANRLSIKGAKIERFVADPQMLEIRHDPGTGALFIIPLTRETSSIFVMTDSGQTHVVLLTPSEKLHSQNLEIIEKPQKASTLATSIPMNSALPVEEAVEEILRDLTKIVSDRTLVSKNTNKPMQTASLKATPDKKWKAGSYWLEHWTLANTSKEEAVIEEANFWHKGILSIAIDRAKVRPGEEVDLWIVRQGDGL
ncbi:MAG: type-F conjugative transfer system secretin TraK [Burkholderiales bacterium]|nr:type-F conjugative transfer system secretin TraK [Burkholderiales bacterium]